MTWDFADENYVISFPFRERLGAVLDWAFVVGRLTEGEIDLVEALLAGDVRAAYEAGWRQGRLAMGLLWPELRRQGAVIAAYREGVMTGLQAARADLERREALLLPPAPGGNGELEESERELVRQVFAGEAT
jgi:hypothetical protein